MYRSFNSFPIQFRCLSNTALCTDHLIASQYNLDVYLTQLYEQISSHFLFFKLISTTIASIAVQKLNFIFLLTNIQKKPTSLISTIFSIWSMESVKKPTPPPSLINTIFSIWSMESVKKPPPLPYQYDLLYMEYGIRQEAHLPSLISTIFSIWSMESVKKPTSPPLSVRSFLYGVWNPSRSPPPLPYQYDLLYGVWNPSRSPPPLMYY